MSRTTVAFFQGKVVPLEAAKVSVMTHALHYGTGCFEGLRGYWNQSKQELYVLQLRPHFERLLQSAGILHMALPYSVDDLCAIALDLLRRDAWREDVYLRPLVYMADETIGARLHNLHADLTMFAIPMNGAMPTQGLKACVSSWRRLSDNAIPARAKIAGAYVNSSLAKTEAFHNGFDDAILLDQEGHVSEGSGMNLFLVRQGKLSTPGVSQDILEGVTRQAVMRIAQSELGLATEERSVDRTELYVADELFMCGTGVQIAPIASVDHRRVGKTGEIGPCTRRIMDVFARAVRAELPAYEDWVTPLYGA